MELVRPVTVGAGAAPWLDASSWWPALDAATAELDPPFGVISRGSLAWNAFSMLDRAAGTPSRVASTAAVTTAASSSTAAAIKVISIAPVYQSRAAAVTG